MDSSKILSWVGFIFFIGLLFATPQMQAWLTELAGWITIIKEDFFSGMNPGLKMGFATIVIVMVLYFVNSFRK